MYVGASAGAAIVGPSIDPIRTLDDAGAAPGLASTNGMSLVNFVVLPHYGKEKYLPRYEAIQKEYGQRYDLIPLTDQQAIWVSADGTHAVIESNLVLHPLPPT
jgi:peptidase E